MPVYVVGFEDVPIRQSKITHLFKSAEGYYSKQSTEEFNTSVQVSEVPCFCIIQMTLKNAIEKWQSVMVLKVGTKTVLDYHEISDIREKEIQLKNNESVLAFDPDTELLVVEAIGKIH